MESITKVEFLPLSLHHHGLLKPSLRQVQSGISEFSFAGLYLFRENYSYEFGFLNELLLIKGNKNHETFCLIPVGLPSWHEIEAILEECDYIKNLSPEQVAHLQPQLDPKRYFFIADRNNWDYIYLTEEMAKLGGKKFHKKRNLIHQFYNLYSNLQSQPLNRQNIRDAHTILQNWGQHHPTNNDYTAAAEALNFMEELDLDGMIFYVDQKPVGYILGERSTRPSDYIIHFEKADPSYKGVYQAIFQRFSQSLLNRFEFINREQDLGDAGLRQAKETYRPVHFIEKYQLRPNHP